MGRKRKTASKKTNPKPKKQIKLENSYDSSSDVPLAVLKQSISNKSKQEANDKHLSASSDPSKKPWVEKCRQWVDEQQQVSEPLPLEPEVDDEPLIDDPSNSPVVTDVPLRLMLKNYSEKEIMYSVMYECEWLKCGFETNEDLKYITHVESHLYQYLSENNEQLTCFWDLCDFQTSCRNEFESHVIYHVYHNRTKTRGASLSSIIRIPKCNGDSRRRNCIENFKTQFRCEWGDCQEPFNKAHLFFMHVNCHVQDQFPVDRKSTKQPIQCQWDGCKQQYIRCSLALEHVRRHSKERTIGCYTCGAMFVSRLKYIDHCRRQVDYHHRVYPCTHCDKLFATQQLMIDHRHTHVRKFFCTLCPLRFPSRKALAIHIRYRHVSIKPFKCPFCPHGCVTKADLEEHVLTHDERHMFRCEEFGCDATYKCQRSLKKHVDSVHYGAVPGIYACHLCNHQYKAGATLSRHLIRAHQFERPPGCTRFSYRANEHGILQLCPYSYEDSSHIETILPDYHQNPATIKIEADKTEEDVAEPGNFTSFCIDKLETVNKNVFSIELKLDEKTDKQASFGAETMTSMNYIETSSTPSLNMKIEIEEPSTSSVFSKSIDDFTVMKRYIKTENPVVISYEEMDSSGSVIRSETVQTTEINREKMLRGNM